MKSALQSVEELMAHPAPGMVFEVHERAGLPRRAHSTPHAWKGGMSADESSELARLAGDAPALRGLVELYRRSNGVDLFILKCPHCEVPHPALSFLPVSEWNEATAAWFPGGEMASGLDSSELYSQGEWRVIATLPSEELRLVLFLSGKYEGEDVAGRIYCIGLDGYLGCHEVVADSIDALLGSVVSDPAGFFNRLGFTWGVDTDLGCYGDVIEAYTPDVRVHPDRAPWPPTRPRQE